MPMTLRSFAKINLHLQVMGRRDDGYHELLTIFQSVDLADLLTLDLSGNGIQLQIREGEAPAGQANLAYRAAQGFLDRWAPDTGVKIDLQKRIPTGGGLGGGSSDAATVLLGLRALLGTPPKRRDLRDLARSLGADVPFFLRGGTALGRGRGDRIEPLVDLEERAVWLVTPPLEISTAEIFGALTAGSLARMNGSGTAFPAQSVDWPVVERGWNDLEEVVMSRFPVVRDVYNVLVEDGASVVRLSGTGASLFAFFAEGVEPSGLTARLPFGTRVHQTRTLTRSSLDRLLVVR